MSLTLRSAIEASHVQENEYNTRIGEIDKQIRALLAEKRLNLEQVKTVKIGKAKDYEKDKMLFLVTTDEIDPDGFTVMKSGAYYYANTRSLFDLLGEDYENVKVIFDLIEMDVNGQKIFKLKKRTLERKKGESEIED